MTVPAGPDSLPRELHELARACGIQSSYTTQTGRRKRARPETILAALRAFGVPVDRLADVPAALAERRQADRDRPLDPVVVAWNGRLSSVDVRVPARVRTARPRVDVELESGEGIDAAGATWTDAPPDRAMGAPRSPTARLSLSLRLPFGYHRLRVAAGPVAASALVVSAPRKASIPARRGWGVFLPLYALRSGRSWGVGDLTDLGDLLEWTAGLGGDLVATLPILAAFLGDPFEPSPYSAASRLFWNELYLDVTAAPELERSPAAREILRSEHLRKEIANLGRSELVDYRAAMATKRQVLEPLARTFFEQNGPRREGFASYLAREPRLTDYAAFRAAGERHRSGWPSWPNPERDGRLPEDGGNRDAFRYHLYVQWLAHEQLGRAAHRARSAGASLYFDCPLGVNASGYDVWRERHVFALGATVGAPPDPFFTTGQDWGFHPLHPLAVRDDEYRYPIACLRHMFRHAGVLRIDHVMSLHRLYWVPRGHGPGEGVYVRYRADELYAILVLEAARAGAAVVGEDLGIVPASVRQAMARHGVHRSYVLPWELTGQRGKPMKTVPERSFASLNTHDLPPFAAYWRGEDLRIRMDRGWVGAEGAARERRSRQGRRAALAAFLRRRGWLEGGEASTDEELILACLSELAASPARELIVNLEDLWQETRPQNVPGTSEEYPNWRRVARHTLERIRRMPQVVGTLRHVDAIRRGKTGR